MMESRVDPVYDFIENEIEKVKNVIKYGNEKVHVDILLQNLLSLIIEQRQELLFVRVQFKLYMILKGYPNQRERARKADRILVAENRWFEGAFQNTEDPVATYSQFLQNLRDQFVPLGVGSLLVPTDELSLSQEENQNTD